MTPPSDQESSGSSFRTVPADELAGAEAHLAARYWDRIRLFALRRVKDAATAEDIAQEAIRLVVEALKAGRVENLEALPGYTFSTAQHLCLQRFRASSREASALGRLSAEPSADRPTDDPLIALIGEERRSAIRRAIADLAPGDRELLTMLYFDEIGSTAAATRLGISPEALRVRKHRALRRLGALLGESREDVTT